MLIWNLFEAAKSAPVFCASAKSLKHCEINARTQSESKEKESLLTHGFEGEESLVKHFMRAETQRLVEIFGIPVKEVRPGCLDKQVYHRIGRHANIKSSIYKIFFIPRLVLLFM